MATTNRTITKLAGMGNSIIGGRVANIITSKLPRGFHVRLIGSMERRLKHIEEYYKVNKKEASEFIKRKQGKNKDILKKYLTRILMTL